MVEPDTVVRWHRSAWRAYWRWKSRRGPGRPHIPAEWQRLILRIATEHPRWGAVRIVGELRALGFEVSARTVSRYRQQALRRPPSQSWRTFLRNHASSIWAADRFTVQTLTFRTRSVFVVIDHGRRRIRHWNVTEHPIAPWIGRQMIEATAWGQQLRLDQEIDVKSRDEVGDLSPPPQGDEIGDFSPVTRRFFAMWWRSWSGRRDSNPRPSAWEAGAPTGCYASFSAATCAACWRAVWPAGGCSGIDQKR